MDWYQNCPIGTKGYPVFIYTTFMDGNYKPYRTDTIPCTQLGMGIISYLKYFYYSGRADPKILKWARYMGDYLINETLTANEGFYPRFTRSSGYNTDFPLKQSAQADRNLGKNVIEPDKGGIAGYALLLLYEATLEDEYLNQALQNADCLTKNMRKGDALHSPWPFRVDAVSGEYRGERNANMVYILRLFDRLLERGYERFREPRQALWTWIKDYQIPAPDNRDSSLWVQFFEDMSAEDNRNSWAPLNLARYLLEKKETIDPDWQIHTRALIDFVNTNFTTVVDGILVCGEQDYDKNPWGGILSTYGAVLAMYCRATESDEFKAIAYQVLNYGLYATFSDGCPSDCTRRLHRGQWQEDCHTDKIHNYLDALNAFPEWAENNSEKRKSP
jgi:hypothetical protein